MNLLKLIHITRKSLGEARWNPRYTTYADKVALFKVIFRLRYLTEIAGNTDTPVTQDIFGYKVTGTGYRELLYLFREIFLNGQYEFQSAQKSPAIVDCGANIGMAILYFKRLYPACKILAFEPNPRVFDLLKRNVQDNKLENVQLVNAGVSATGGDIEFFVDSQNSLISSVDKNRGGTEVIHVPTHRLSQFLQGQHFDFAKIDVEGAEGEVLTDLHETNTIGNIQEYIFEYHHNIPHTKLKLSEFLKTLEQHQYGYNIRTDFYVAGDFQDIAVHARKA